MSDQFKGCLSFSLKAMTAANINTNVTVTHSKVHAVYSVVG